MDQDLVEQGSPKPRKARLRVPQVRRDITLPIFRIARASRPAANECKALERLGFFECETE